MATWNHKVKHLLSDARGIYIPRDFVQGFAIECKEEDAQAAMWDACYP